MIYINDTPLYEMPGSCGTCPFFHDGHSAMVPVSGTGMCLLFYEEHHSWKAVPGRCSKLFRKGLTYPEGSKLVIVTNNEQD